MKIAITYDQKAPQRVGQLASTKPTMKMMTMGVMLSMKHLIVVEALVDFFHHFYHFYAMLNWLKPIEMPVYDSCMCQMQSIQIDQQSLSVVQLRSFQEIRRTSVTCLFL